MQWDHSYRDGDTRIWEAYFTSQDASTALTLRDYGGKALELVDHAEFIYATAERVSTPNPGWNITLRQSPPVHTYRKRKDDAIDVMLGRS